MDNHTHCQCLHTRLLFVFLFFSKSPNWLYIWLVSKHLVIFLNFFHFDPQPSCMDHYLEGSVGMLYKLCMLLACFSEWNPLKLPLLTSIRNSLYTLVCLILFIWFTVIVTEHRYEQSRGFVSERFHNTYLQAGKREEDKSVGSSNLYKVIMGILRLLYLDFLTPPSAGLPPWYNCCNLIFRWQKPWRSLGHGACLTVPPALHPYALTKKSPCSRQYTLDLSTTPLANPPDP